MSSLKLTETEMSQLREIELKTENCTLKIKLLNEDIVKLQNSFTGIINAFCKANGKDPNKISNLTPQGEITFQEEEKSEA